MSRASPPASLQVPGAKDLSSQFWDNGKITEKDFDLVVLSVGMEPDMSAVAAAKKLGMELNEYRFAATDRLAPLTTSRRACLPPALSRSRKISRKP